MSVNEDTSALEAANKELVREWFALLSAGQMDKAAAMVDPEATVWVPRARKEVPAGAWFGGYQQILDNFPKVSSSKPAPSPPRTTGWQ